MELFILNKNEEVVCVLSGNAEKSASHFFNAQITKEANKGCQLTFEFDMTEDGNEHIIEENMVVFKDGDVHRLVIIKEICDIHGEDFIKEVFCEDSYIELYDEVILEEMQSDVSLELDEALNHILQNTRWTMGEVDDVNRIKLNPEYKAKTVLEGINLLLNAYDVEVDFKVEFVGNQITRRLVTMKRQLGRDLGKRIEFGKDMESVKRTTNTGDIKTAVIPFGKIDEETQQPLTIADVVWTKEKNGLDKPLGQVYLEDPEATEVWGYKGENGQKRPRWIAIQYDDVDDPNELIKYANLQLASHKKPSVTYEVEAVDLYKLLDDEDYSFETVEIGDTVAIIDHDFNPPLTLTSRVIKIEENFSQTNTERKITLGSHIGSIVDKDVKTQVNELGAAVGSVNVDLSGIHTALESLNKKTGTGVWSQIEAINQILFGSTTGYHYMSEGDGIWIYDKPLNQNPTKALALKGGSLGLAQWDQQTQSWKVGTFIDGNMVNASMINTGFLNADRIQAGSIKAEKLEVHLKDKIDNATTTEEVETLLTAKGEEIELSVSKKYETKEGVSDKINNIVIGGRNYVRDYKFQRQGIWQSSSSNAIVDNESECGYLVGTTSNPHLYQDFKVGEFVKGDTLTIQFEYKTEGVEANTGTNSFLIRPQLSGYLNDGTYVSDVAIFSKLESVISKDSDWQKVVATATITTNNAFDYTRLRLYARNFTGKIYFKDIMLERGTKASDVIPSIDDYKTEYEVNDSLQGLVDQTQTLQEEYENITNDKKITPNEKLQFKVELAQIKSKTEAMGEVVADLKDSTLTMFMDTVKAKCRDVENVLEPILANMTITSDVDENIVYTEIVEFYEAYEVALKLAQMSMNATVSETKAEIRTMSDGINMAVSNSKEAIDWKYQSKKHFNFTDQGWVEIFASVNGNEGRFKTQITDQQLAFTDSGNVVAYLSNQELYITTARIVNALQIGNISLEKSGDKGGIIFKWKD